MNTPEIIAALEREKANEETIARRAQARAQQLQTAIAALRGEDAGPKLSVVEMVLAAARKLHQDTKGAAFDHKTLVAVASELHPAEHTLIKNGIYAAVAKLKKDARLTLAPGGFQYSEAAR